MKARRLGTLAAVPAGLLLSGLLVIGASSAAFTAQTTTGDKAWSTGHITLDNDATQSEDLAFHDIRPGDTGQSEVEVTFSGTIHSAISMFAETDGAEPNALHDALRLTVADDTGATLFAGSLRDLVDGHTSPESSLVQDWTTADDESRLFTIAWEFQADSDDEAVQNETASMRFVWRAQTV